jgi:ribonuclease P protein component
VREGERRRGPLFIIEVLDRHEPDTAPRAGFTVTKKQGNAVQRNRIRRRLREAIRLSGQFEMQPGHDYVIVGHKDVLEVSFDELTKALVTRISSRQKQKNRAPGKSDGKQP